ncbi:MAG TPA: isoprenylcysteine carboxylmethyltransferase family protein [Chthoniobacterales bacterium]|jgi:protein-S-isoprenylcysteine O-methyltransferase Ste14|nr:isoprenylcysteine carboxylmethyltransferase family protein [Chthoniobacterales bacterium]
MSEHALHLISVYILQIGWILFGAIFIFRKRWPRDKTRKRDPASVLGILIQTSSLFAVWMFARRSHTLLPLGFWFQLLSTALVVVIVAVSVWTMWSALRVLGKQWSLQARVLENHQLIREGPYRFVRHPIYTGILGMIIAGGLAWSHWIGLVVALMLFGIGTAIRVRSEEKLLREQFGAAFDDYKRSVPAVLPIKL